jgi:glycosyltransferase involved in cell wall biosynthesis
MNASVIIATRDKARYLELTLASYALQTASDYEILVADDGSSDDTEAVVAAARVPVRYLKKLHGGRAHARNHALAEARGRIVIFSDDDRIVAPGFVAAHVARADQQVQVLGWQEGIISRMEPRLHLPLETLRDFSARFPGAEGPLFTADELLRDFDSVVKRHAIAERWWQHVQPAIERWGEDLSAMSIPWVLGTTGNLSAPRQAILDAGGLDEEFRGWGLEDLELCYRLFHRGLRPIIDRAAINYHQAHPTDSRKRTDWLRNLGVLMERHPSLEIARYACELTQQKRDADWTRLDAELRAIENEKPPQAVRDALRDASIALARRRVEGLLASGFVYFLGVSQADW